MQSVTEDTCPKIAVLDDDQKWLDMVSGLYATCEATVETYLFDTEYKKFLKEINQCDIVLIDHGLKGEKFEMSAASVIEDVNKAGYHGKTYIVSSYTSKRCESLGCYINNESLVGNPLQIFSNMSRLRRLRELTERLPSLLEAITPSADGTELHIDGWTNPYTGLLNQPSCGICHSKACKGDTQPGFYAAEKIITIVVDGHVEFDTSCGDEVSHHSLGPGDIAEVPAGSNHHPLVWQEDCETLLISIPCWEGTPEVKGNEDE